jgi:molybdate transport system substrate-binding protein
MRIAILLVAGVLALAGCGDDGGTGGGKPALTVSAATSLKTALTNYGDKYDDATVRYSFAGSDELAAQIRQGVKPDVYAAANTKLPEQLFEEGLVEQPQVFAGNELVIAVPTGSDITSIDDLQRPGTSLVIGDKDVPVGAYTQTVLDKLPPATKDAILENVKSEEPDVGGVVGKLTQGAADAGFVYASDVKGAGDSLKAMRLPAELKPQVSYGIAVVKGAKEPEAAKAYIEGLVAGAGQEELTAAGFLPPPER